MARTGRRRSDRAPRRDGREGSRCFFPALSSPPVPPLFPYTTLFRSAARPAPARGPSSSSPRPPRSRARVARDRKSTRLNSSHRCISYAVFCLKKKLHPATLDVLLPHRLESERVVGIEIAVDGVECRV